jgi:hypothetical protein
MSYPMALPARYAPKPQLLYPYDDTTSKQALIRHNLERGTGI